MNLVGRITRIDAWELNKYSYDPTILVGTKVTVTGSRQVRNHNGEYESKEVDVTLPFVFPEAATFTIGDELIINATLAPSPEPDEDRDLVPEDHAFEIIAAGIVDEHLEGQYDEDQGEGQVEG